MDTISVPNVAMILNWTKNGDNNGEVGREDDRDLEELARCGVLAESGQTRPKPSRWLNASLVERNTQHLSDS